MADGSSAVPSKSPPVVDPLVGRVIGDRFRITSVLARGGMGKIYRAEQVPLGRVCALKVLNPSLGGSEQEFHKRFSLEASIASKLTHPNTVTIFDYGRTDDDIYYMAMEYLEGQTLQRAIRTAGAFAEERAAHIARQICRALREAHGLGVIHRDLKPANIFLVEHGDETDFVKVLDFGLVKEVDGEGSGEELTRVGVFVGSPKYMSPEQIRGERVDARTDIYALGTMLFEMVAGRVPFARATIVQVMVAQVNDALPPIREVNPAANVSAAFEETVAKCLAKDPDQRFRSMDEVLASLKRLGSIVPGPPGAFAGRDVPASGELPTADATGSGFTSGTAAASGSRSVPPARESDEEEAVSVPISAPVISVNLDAEPNGLPSPQPIPVSGDASSLPQVSAPAAHGAMAALPAVHSAVQSDLTFPGAGGRRASKVVWLLAAAAAIGIAAAVAMRPSGEQSSGAGASAAPSASAIASLAPQDEGATPAKAPSSTPPGDLVTVRVTTDPDGAEVRENGSLICSSTPCDIPYTGADADPARGHKLSVLLDGYRNESRSIRVGDSPVILRLTKLVDAGRAL